MTQGRRLSTRLIHGGRGTRRTVHPALERASTVLLPRAEDLYDQPRSPYGRMGHGLHRELEDALCELEGGVAARLAPNGLSACTLAISALVKAGDHLLVSDSIYGPTRRFCQRHLKRMGVEASFFDPRAGAGIKEHIRDNTAAVALESPGSLTFEVHDLPAILSVTRPRGIATMLDNTWSAGVYHTPLAFGVDLSVQALTKYVVGHADAFGGAVIAGNEAAAGRLGRTADDFGFSLGPEEAWSALRGLRTLPQRLKLHERAALELADHLAGHAAVARVIHPARTDHPDHGVWERDFTGSSGLFAIELHPASPEAVNAALNRLELFGFGFSWGGFESLAIPCDPQLKRTASRTGDHGPLVRIHAGLEDIEDLKADLDRALDGLSR